MALPVPTDVVARVAVVEETVFSPDSPPDIHHKVSDYTLASADVVVVDAAAAALSLKLVAVAVAVLVGYPYVYNTKAPQTVVVAHH